MRSTLTFFIIIFFGFLQASSAKDKKTLRIVTHESAPLMSSDLPDGGALIYSLRSLLKQMGYDLNMVYVSSWARAKIMAMNDKRIDGYFPYATRENENEFVFSEYFLKDPWVIVERKDHPIEWKTFADLTKYTAGNVTGVELRPGVKELYEAGKLKVETTSTNLYNVQKLVNKRVDFIFIDLFLYNNEMSDNPEFKKYKDKLQINPKPIIVGEYGLALRKTKANMDFLKEFNKISPGAFDLVIEYMQKMKKADKPIGKK